MYPHECCVTHWDRRPDTLLCAVVVVQSNEDVYAGRELPNALNRTKDASKKINFVVEIEHSCNE